MAFNVQSTREDHIGRLEPGASQGHFREQLMKRRDVTEQNGSLSQKMNMFKQSVAFSLVLFAKKTLPLVNQNTQEVKNERFLIVYFDFFFVLNASSHRCFRLPLVSLQPLTADAGKTDALETGIREWRSHAQPQ